MLVWLSLSPGCSPISKARTKRSWALRAVTGARWSAAMFSELSQSSLCQLPPCTVQSVMLMHHIGHMVNRLKHLNGNSYTSTQNVFDSTADSNQRYWTVKDCGTTVVYLCHVSWICISKYTRYELMRLPLCMVCLLWYKTVRAHQRLDFNLLKSGKYGKSEVCEGLNSYESWCGRCNTACLS